MWSYRGIRTRRGNDTDNMFRVKRYHCVRVDLSTLLLLSSQWRIAHLVEASSLLLAERYIFCRRWSNHSCCHRSDVHIIISTSANDRLLVGMGTLLAPNYIYWYSTVALHLLYCSRLSEYNFFSLVHSLHLDDGFFNLKTESFNCLVLVDSHKTRASIKTGREKRALKIDMHSQLMQRKCTNKYWMAFLHAHYFRSLVSNSSMLYVRRTEI